MRPQGPLSALLVVLVALVLAGCGSTSPPAPTAPAAPGLAAPSMTAAALAPVDPATVHPTRVRIAAIGADSSLVPVGLNVDGQLQTPPVADPKQAAWYRFGPVPGNLGPAVIVGHINGDGQPGVFAHLADLKSGATIDVARSNGTTATFQVRRVDVVKKEQFPTSTVYSDTGNSQLRLISCGGDLDSTGHNYDSQVIAYADLLGAHRP